MRVRWTVFGREITTLEFGSDQSAIEAIAELLSSDVSGGQSHNFERDVDPADPDDRYRWDEGKKFGFSRAIGKKLSDDLG